MTETSDRASEAFGLSLAAEDTRRQNETIREPPIEASSPLAPGTARARNPAMLVFHQGSVSVELCSRNHFAWVP